MFTGIVSRVAYIDDILKQDGGYKITIVVDEDLSDLNIGDSISISGCCLTIIAKNNNSLEFFVSDETLKITTISTYEQNTPINFEKAMLVSSRINGHKVSGHIDCTCKVVLADVQNGNIRLDIEMPQQFINYISMKGSIAIDGVSLTIMNIDKNVITLNIIPHTIANTTLRFLNTTNNNIVNVEFDEMVKIIYNAINEYFKTR